MAKFSNAKCEWKPWLALGVCSMKRESVCSFSKQTYRTFGSTISDMVLLLCSKKSACPGSICCFAMCLNTVYLLAVPRLGVKKRKSIHIGAGGRAPFPSQCAPVPSSTQPPISFSHLAPVLAATKKLIHCRYFFFFLNRQHPPSETQITAVTYK